MQFINFLSFFNGSSHGQVISKDNKKNGLCFGDTDKRLMTFNWKKLLFQKKDWMLKQFLILQSRVYRTYPYAKLASERLTLLNKGMKGFLIKKSDSR
jgi:hypothetical protein